MNHSQKIAIRDYQSDLVDTLERVIEAFVAHLEIAKIIKVDEWQIVDGKNLSNRAKLVELIAILQQKDNSWEEILKYLANSRALNLAEKLKQTAEIAERESGVNAISTSLSEDGQTQVPCLTSVIDDYYSSAYLVVENFDDESEEIESVFVDLQFEGKMKSMTDLNGIYTELAKQKRRVTVIRGQPGSGKTTLVKKIIADRKVHSQLSRFDLILAVPLRGIQIGSDPLEMAIGFFLSANGRATSQQETKRLSEAVRQSKKNILVILDGLDEYKLQPNSLLGSIFDCAFKHNTNCKYPIILNYELMVTARPYACQIVAENILVDRYEIVGFPQARQATFLQKRCKSEAGRKRATEYLKNSAVLSEISQSPLLLLFVCFLSDQNIEIPGNLTRLYEIFMFRMLIRSLKKGSIGSFDQQNWRHSDLVSRLGSLALLGVLKSKFEFNMAEREMCEINEESFHSGLLLFKIDQISLAHKAVFSHRSIQEFIAALHSVDFWGSSTLASLTGWSEDIWSIREISEMKVHTLAAKMLHFEDSQFCRFYFGLLSGQPEFEMRIKNSLEEYADAEIINSGFLGFLSECLADCSDDECFLTGKILNSFVDKSFFRLVMGSTDVQKIKKKIFRWTEEIGTWLYGRRKNPKFRPHLQSGLRLKWIGNSLNLFCIEGKSEIAAKVIRIWLDEENLTEKIVEFRSLEEVEWLLIDQPGYLDDWENLKSTIETINLLPKCRNFFIIDGSGDDFIFRLTVNIKVGEQEEVADEQSSSSGMNPEFFYFEIEKTFSQKLFDKLSSIDSTEVQVLSVARPYSNRGHLKLAIDKSLSFLDFLKSGKVFLDDLCSK